MRFTKIAFTVSYKALLLFVCLFVSGFAWLVCQAPDSTFILDSDYVLWHWPGRLMRLKPTYWDDIKVMGVEYIDPLRDYDVNSFAVIDEFIVGRARRGWFAINRQTHEVWYPYESQEELKSAANVVFSDSDLTTTLPWSRMVIHLRTKIALPSIWLFFAIALIGFRRSGRSIKFLCKPVQKLVKKPAIDWH